MVNCSSCQATALAAGVLARKGGYQRRVYWGEEGCWIKAGVVGQTTVFTGWGRTDEEQ